MVQRVMPDNAVGLVPAPGCHTIQAYSKHWPCLFPQHGSGRKHDRPIRLEPWQREIVEATPDRSSAGCSTPTGAAS